MLSGGSGMVSDQNGQMQKGEEEVSANVDDHMQDIIILSYAQCINISRLFLARVAYVHK